MQEARGASLSHENSATTGQSTRRRTWLLFAAVAVLAFVVDLTTKEWALKALVDKDIAVIGDFLTFHLVFNPGAAFGTGTEYTWVFTCLSAVALVVAIWLSRRLGSVLWSIGLGFLVGGVSGNFFDRIFRQPEMFHGHVVDFLRLPNWPVFNIADMCINAAAAVIILQTFRGVRLDGSREEDHAKDKAAKSEESEPVLAGEENEQ